LSRARLRPRARATAVGLVAAALLLTACTGDADPSGAPTSASPSTSDPAATAPTDPVTTPTAPDDGVRFDAARLERYLEQDLRWEDCGGRYECADLRVPARYDEPDGDTFDVALIRLPARDPDRRIGALVLNPGGPGGSGVSYVRASTFVTTERVRARYDLVGLDPRGVQGSDPAVACLTDRQLDRFIATDASPDTSRELRRVERVSRGFGAGCAARSPELYGLMGTRDAAYDLEVLRAALGEERLNYLGKSYGTLLGITFAESFPDRVGRFVLDGVLDPALDAEAMLAGQAAGFERALAAFVADCVRRADCPLGSTRAGAQRRLVTWVDRLDRRPVGRPGTRRLTQPWAQLALIGSLYDDRRQWPALRSALSDAFTGSPVAMLAIADSTVGRRSDGSFATNATQAQYAVTCLDRDYDADLAQTQDRAARFDAAYPVFGAYLAWGDLPCGLWPSEPTRVAHEITVDVPPLLILSTSRDPATPYAWGASLARQLGDATLLRWVADGHTAYVRGSECVDDAVDAWLVDGALPDRDPTCRGR
jgi:pimeloyl-ACP methyl ester carboxylesterase